MIPKFKIGDKVCINPFATREDFEENFCTPDFINHIDKVFEIIRMEKEPSGQYSYKLKLRNGSWYVLEKCLTPTREDNEI